MIREVTDREVVSAYVRAVKDRLRAGSHNDAAEQAANKRGLNDAAERAAEPRGPNTPSANGAALLFANKLPDDGLGEETEPKGQEPFISRQPLVSLVQTSLAAHLHKEGLADETPADHPHHGVFSHVWQTVKDFVQEGRLTERAAATAGEIAEGVLTRLAEGWHPFNETPAAHQLEHDNVRLIVVGDWGSGLKQANAVAELMAHQVQAGLDEGRSVHVIHLGDVYFAGEEEEYRDHVLANGWWPVTTDQWNAGVGSWALAGNHDLYGGARAYFNTMLADDRFGLQRTDGGQANDGETKDGEPTSWFRLTTPSWEIIGLDTSWNDDPLQFGQTGLLQDPQAATIADWVAADRESAAPHKRLILSHHQLMSAYDTRLLDELKANREPVLLQKASQIVDAGPITAWIWGHEHRCMAFDDKRFGIAFPRCLGHGGQLQQAHPSGTKPPQPGTWEETAQFKYAGQSFGYLGFAVLDLQEPDGDGGHIQVTYHLAGAQPTVPSEVFR